MYEKALALAAEKMTALVASANPILTAVLAAALLGEPLTGRKIAGLLLGIGGVAVVVDLLVGGLGLFDERELERGAFGSLRTRGDADAAHLGIVGLR